MSSIPANLPLRNDLIGDLSLVKSILAALSNFIQRFRQIGIA